MKNLEPQIKRLFRGAQKRFFLKESVISIAHDSLCDVPASQNQNQGYMV